MLLFPRKAIARFGEGLDILLFEVKYFEVEKISRASMGGSTTVSFFCVEKKSQMRLAFLD